MSVAIVHSARIPAATISTPNATILIRWRRKNVCGGGGGAAKASALALTWGTLIGNARVAKRTHAFPLAPRVGHRRRRGGIVRRVKQPEEDGVADVGADVGRGAVRELVVREE